MQTSSTSQYDISDAEKGSLPSSQGSGDAIIEIDSRAATLAVRSSDLEALKHHATKDTTEPAECKPSAAEAERKKKKDYHHTMYVYKHSPWVTRH
jgi:hypothetical protein